MTKRLMVIYLLASFTTMAQAESASLPAELIKVRELTFAACRESGGRPSAKRSYIQTADFNDDGRPDYVVDDGESNCDGASASYCGSGGCSIEVYVSTPSGYRSANLQRLGFGATIKRSTDGPILIIDGRHSAISYRWNGSVFQPVKRR